MRKVTVSIPEVHMSYLTMLADDEASDYDIKELANLIRNNINPKIQLIKRELPKDDPLRRKPVIKLANELLGWKPNISLEEGLKPTIEWFKEELNRNYK